VKPACPACRSTSVTRAPDQGRLAVSEGFRVFPLKRCADCGHVWEPRAPAWLLIIGIVLGMAMLVLAALLLTDAKGLGFGRAALAGAMGLLTIAGCVRRMRSRRGKGS